MDEITTVGLDLAKRVFQVHGADAKGARFFRRSFGVRADNARRKLGEKAQHVHGGLRLLAAMTRG